nr:PDR/VanB family oxidoreductase [Mycolicibacter acidiphilus]
MDAWRRFFVTGQAAPLLARSNPVRYHGFEFAAVVDRKQRITTDVVTLTLRAPDGGPLPSWSPGAHLDVFLPSGRQRQYSLCGDPADRTAYRIAVRRIATGGGGSMEVHDELAEGSAIRIRGPRNAFDLVDATSYLFVAGGIGITPILPMAKTVGDRGQLVYTGRSRASMPLLDELPAGAAIHADDESGPPEIAALIARAEPGAAVYVCGPAPMLAAAHLAMDRLNPTGSLHTERFTPPPVIDGREFDLTLARTGITIRVASDETALDAIRREAPGVSYSCRQGFCRSCRVDVLDGAVQHRDRALTEAERRNQMCTCVSRAAGDHLVIDL